MTIDFTQVSESSGDDVTAEQIERICHRYVWAGQFCKGKDVLEVACGNGQGLGYLGQLAKSLHAGDIDRTFVELAKAYYGKKVSIERMDAQELPFDDNSLDIIILFEAIYYLPDANKFMSECKRVLRKGGQILIATANKDLSDFNPSPHSHVYFGSRELVELMNKFGFASKLFGYWPIVDGGFKQRILSLIKKIVVASGLMPKTMAGKKLMKRIVFGSLTPMPAEITGSMIKYQEPAPVDGSRPDQSHKVIYCVGTL